MSDRNHAIEILEGALLVLREFDSGSEKDKAQIAQIESVIKIIKIFYAKDMSKGKIKKDISRDDLIKWLQGINQAATSVSDNYTMKATTQIIAILLAQTIGDIRGEKKIEKENQNETKGRKG